MVSPDLLRRYPFFSRLGNAELKAIAAIAEQAFIRKGEIIVQAGQPAEALYFVLEGLPEYVYALVGAELYVEGIQPGEVIGMSAMFDPYLYRATIRAVTPCRLLRLEAATVRELCDSNALAGYQIMREMTRTAINRLMQAHRQIASFPAAEQPA